MPGVDILDSTNLVFRVLILLSPGVKSEPELTWKSDCAMVKVYLASRAGERSRCPVLVRLFSRAIKSARVELQWKRLYYSIEKD